MNMTIAELVANVHRIATGNPITTDGALAYFRDPPLLRSLVEQSGCLNDPAKQRQIAEILQRCENDFRALGTSYRRCA